ncbi:hypothetical protein GCM10010254_13250 [Streptomyces chromofuscus]|nr:hypothetical protein GCM10010254_13250 [Streptomyces chromofuscus]
MIGGCLSLRGAGQHGAPPGGSAPYASTVPRTGRLPVRMSRSRFRAGQSGSQPRLLTVAGQRRICTGFPPYGCDDDPATLPGRSATPEGRSVHVFERGIGRPPGCGSSGREGPTTASGPVHMA